MIKIHSALIVLLLALIVQGCQQKMLMETTEDNNDNCEHNGKLTPKERSAIYPFNKATKIQVISFPSSLWKAPLEADTINTLKTKEIVTLNIAQIDSLTNIFYNYNYPKQQGMAAHSTTKNGCYYPRHAIVFLDKNNKIIEYFEVCLECQGYKTNIPEENLGEFCEGKYDLLKAYFVSIGIAFFDDDPWINNQPSKD